MLRNILAAVASTFARALRGLLFALAVAWEFLTIPVRLFKAAAKAPPTSAEVEAAQARSEVRKLAAEAHETARRAEVVRVANMPPWLAAKYTAHAVLEGGERPDASHLDDRIQAWLAAMTHREARIVDGETPEYVASWLAGRRRIFGLELPSDADVKEFVAGVETVEDDGPAMRVA